jgi:hypothetical protein
MPAGPLPTTAKRRPVVRDDDASVVVPRAKTSRAHARASRASAASARAVDMNRARACECGLHQFIHFISFFVERELRVNKTKETRDQRIIAMV